MPSYLYFDLPFFLWKAPVNGGRSNVRPSPTTRGSPASVRIRIKRSPISVRTREFVQQTGLIAIVMLMGLAFWNDLSRHWTQFVEWVF